MGRKLSSHLMRGSLDLMVLSVLADGPTYGYQIHKRIREAGGSMTRLQAGTLYPLLAKLELQGAIASRWDETTGRKRKWYELTEAGRSLLDRQASDWNAYVSAIRGLLGGLRPASQAPLSEQA